MPRHVITPPDTFGGRARLVAVVRFSRDGDGRTSVEVVATGAPEPAPDHPHS